MLMNNIYMQINNEDAEMPTNVFVAVENLLTKYPALE